MSVLGAAGAPRPAGRGGLAVRAGRLVRHGPVNGVPVNGGPVPHGPVRHGPVNGGPSPMSRARVRRTRHRAPIGQVVVEAGVGHGGPYREPGLPEGYELVVRRTAAERYR